MTKNDTLVPEVHLEIVRWVNKVGKQGREGRALTGADT